MKFVSCLSGESIFTLKEVMKNHPNFTVRAHSILLSNHRIKIKDIAKIYEVTRQTVSNWIEYLEEFGIVGLYDHPRSGRPPKLNFFEKETVKALIDPPILQKCCLVNFLKQWVKVSVVPH